MFPQSLHSGAPSRRRPDIRIKIKLEKPETTSKLCHLDSFLSRFLTLVNLRPTFLSPSSADLSPIIATHSQCIQRAPTETFVEQQGSSLVVKRLPVTEVTYDRKKRTYNIWTPDLERAHFVYGSLCIPCARVWNGQQADEERDEEVFAIVKKDSTAQLWTDARVVVHL